MLLSMYEATTSVLSGSDRLTRVLEMTEFDWQIELYAMFPSYLRNLAEEFPETLEQTGGTLKTPLLTRMQRNIRAAHAQSKQQWFDPHQEFVQRRVEARAAYVRHLAYKMGHVKKLRDVMAAKIEESDSDSMKDEDETEAEEETRRNAENTKRKKPPSGVPVGDFDPLKHKIKFPNLPWFKKHIKSTGKAFSFQTPSEHLLF